uniref:Rab9 effector protein with kelch motifs n=1 Tax=Melopsittacus undulatus TaxID=13146 RepID=A0A8V5GDQ9_MELUD
MGPRSLPPLEPGGRPQRGQWYRLRPQGERPCGRVGHGCLLLPGGGSGTGRVLILGGADPAGAFADAHFVELGTHRWAAAGWSGLRPRYEHATFLPSAGSPRVWVFGGAHPAGNRSCVQVLDPEIGTWESPEVSGEQPLPRTFHTSSAAIEKCLYVFGGGEKGAEPVRDQRLHVFDTATLTWSQPDTHGEPPSPRHGHVVVAVGTKLFIHGGLAGDVFYNDLFCIDTSEYGQRYQSDAASGQVWVWGTSFSLYIQNQSNAWWVPDEKQQWTLLQFDAPLPAGRLDHAMCVIPWWVGKSEHTGGDTGEATAGPLLQSQDEGHAGATVVHLLLVFGGMDTQGEIYRDCIVSLIE